MLNLTLIRHGQAQTGARDEATYDKLSDLGHQQANWLGEHLKDHHAQYDRVISGDMRRQRETAQSMLMDLPHDTDPRLNEIDYFGLAHALHARHGVGFPKDQAGFEAHIERILSFWATEEMDAGLESYDAFTTRITDALQDANAAGQRTLLVTSTGVIATLVALALKLDRNAHAHAFLGIAHTSKHRFQVKPHRIELRQYGALPHLERADRAHAVTFI